MELIFGYLFIFGARVVDVSLATIRMLMIVRGRRLEAAVIGFFEVSVYIWALGRVVSQLSNPVNLLVYALGFSTGNYVGSLLEERLAMGYVTLQVITRTESGQALTEGLRDRGFGVTTFLGEGKEGPKTILLVSVKRKLLPAVMKYIDSQAQDAFITVLDTRRLVGGLVDPKRV